MMEEILHMEHLNEKNSQWDARIGEVEIEIFELN